MAKSVTPDSQPAPLPKGMHRVRLQHDAIVTDAAHPYPCDRVIVIDGASYEHVSTDPDGVWVYRNLDAR